jgi:hypothetical protein
MSALPPKADMCSALAHVCFGPKADMSLSVRMSAAGGVAALRHPHKFRQPKIFAVQKNQKMNSAIFPVL